MKISEDLSVGLGNTKPNLRARGWAFTIFDIKEDTKYLISQIFNQWIIGDETCPETGRPHLQCYGYRKTQITLSKLKKVWPTVHFEVAKGKPWENYVYCSKGGKFESNMKIDAPVKPVKTISEDELYDWQKKVLSICKEEPDDRTIWWFWEPIGNVGKSAFCKFLAVHYEAIVITTSKSADIATCIENERNLYIFDFPRSCEGFCPWNGIEQLKNGLITEAKLKKKAKTTIINCPHVICFANWVPENIPLSPDRLKIERIE